MREDKNGDDNLAMREIIEKCLNKIIKKEPDANLIKIDKYYHDVSQEFIKKRKLGVGVADNKLKGKWLEWKVYEIFEDMGIDIILDENDETHDGIIIFETKGSDFPVLKFVLEIKGHDKGGARIGDDLRQLDDWVFRVSGEEKARKERVLVSEPTWSYGESRQGPGYFQHPDPHKGLFILNHDIKNEPADRCAPFASNEINFSESRNHCLIDFLSFLKLYDKWKGDLYTLEDILLALYKTVGVFRFVNLEKR